MSSKIVVLESSATIQGLIKEKLRNSDVELSFEDKGLKLLVSVYNSVPAAILINSSSVNPKASLLVRLIKNIEKLRKVPVGVYTTGEFVFEEQFRKTCGADIFFRLSKNNIKEKTDSLLDLIGKRLAVPLQSDLVKNGLSDSIFNLIQNLNSFENLIQSFLNLIAKTCRIPATALYIDDPDGPKSYYICGNNFTKKEESDFLKVCTTDFEAAFSDSNSASIITKKLKNTDIQEIFHTNDIPLSAYQNFFLMSKDNKKIGSVHVIKEGTFSSAQLDLINFAVESFSMLMDNALMIKEKLKFERNIRKAFSRFVPEQIIDELVMNAEREAKVGVGEKRDVAILFSDIRSFTNISERNRPETIVAFLNRYFTIMCTIIKKHGGTVDKFIGDAIMALFGAPVSYEDNARRAVAAAYEMREALASVPIEDLYLPDGMKFDIGIGIHYGDVIVGSIGSEDKTDYSVIGDNVNLASRLEGLTKTYGAKILVSQAVKDEIKPDEFIFRLLDDVKVKGKKTAVPIYAIDRNIEEFSGIYRDSYKKGLALYKQGIFNLALEYFTKAITESPDDKASKLMKSRCEEFIKNPPENWDGAIAFTTK